MNFVEGDMINGSLGKNLNSAKFVISGLCAHSHLVEF